MFRRSGLFLLAATPLVVVLAAFSALAVSQDAAGGHDHAHRAAAGITAKELKLRNDMRRLWEDHVTWTRLAVISLTTSSPDTKATVGRLLRNQVHIGNAVKPYYGRAAGVELTRLLREHITIAAALVAAAKDGDQARARFVSAALGGERRRDRAVPQPGESPLEAGADARDDARPPAPDRA